MPVTTLYALLDALVAAARAALPAIAVYDSYGVTDDPGDYLMIGVDDPDRPTAAASASVVQEPGPMGTGRPRDEEGEITCAALSWNGDGNPSAARAGCKTITDAMEALVRTTAYPALGVSGVKALDFGSLFTLEQDQNDAGAMALVIFTVKFRARI